MCNCGQCYFCRGKGEVTKPSGETTTCPVCYGRGSTPDNESVRVDDDDDRYVQSY